MIQREKTGMVENVVITLCDCSTWKARLMAKSIAMLSGAQSELSRRMPAKLRKEYPALVTVKQWKHENIVPAAALTALAKAWTNQIATVAEIAPNKSVLGTGTAVPSAGDTAADTEVYRKNIASQSNDNNVSYNTAFYEAG